MLRYAKLANGEVIAAGQDGGRICQRERAGMRSRARSIRCRGALKDESAIAQSRRRLSTRYAACDNFVCKLLHMGNRPYTVS